MASSQAELLTDEFCSGEAGLGIVGNDSCTSKCTLKYWGSIYGANLREDTAQPLASSVISAPWLCEKGDGYVFQS